MIYAFYVIFFSSYIFSFMCSYFVCLSYVRNKHRSLAFTGAVRKLFTIAGIPCAPDITMRIEVSAEYERYSCNCLL